MAIEQISKGCLTSILKEYRNCNIEILNYAISDLMPSENYSCSDIRRITITYLSDNTNQLEIFIIAKCLPQNAYMAEFVTNTKVFECEIAVYQLVLPQMSKLYYTEKVAPTVYHVSLTPKPILLLEDLSQMNYKVLCKKKGLDMKHCLLVIEKLAYFHAASAAIHEQDSSILTQFNQACIRKVEPVTSVAEKSYDMLIKYCKSRKEHQQYVDKLTLNKQRILNSIFDIHKTNTKFKVLNHGDAWTHNFLFYYTNNNKLADVAFIDYQFAYYGSPCLDLHYFITTSLQLSTKKQVNTIVDHYFKNLIKCLDKLHVAVLPSRKEFEEDFLKFIYYGFGTSIVCLPFFKTSHTDVSIESFLKGDDVNSFRYNCFYNEEYVQEINHYLPYYDKLGIFEESV